MCIAGGGPAGLMLALLLARSGIRVVLLEKHADFLRDFRGDTVHRSTMDLPDGLGLGPELDDVPHRDARRLAVTFADGTFTLADVTISELMPPSCQPSGRRPDSHRRYEVLPISDQVRSGTQRLLLRR